jgi:hypothetical protein
MFPLRVPSKNTHAQTHTHFFSLRNMYFIAAVCVKKHDAAEAMTVRVRAQREALGRHLTKGKEADGDTVPAHQ